MVTNHSKFPRNFFGELPITIMREGKEAFMAIPIVPIVVALGAAIAQECGSGEGAKDKVEVKSKSLDAVEARRSLRELESGTSHGRTKVNADGTFGNKI